MVAISKFTLLALAAVSVAAPAPAPAAAESLTQFHALAKRSLENAPSDNLLKSKRFIEEFHAVALQERTITDVMKLIDIFSELTTNGIKFFAQSFDAFFKADRKLLNSSIQTFLVQAQGFLNKFTTWLQDYKGLGGITKIFADLFVKSGLKSFITHIGLGIMQFSSAVLGADWSAQTFAADLKNLQNSLKDIASDLAVSFPGLEQARAVIDYTHDTIRNLLGLPAKPKMLH